MKRGSIVFFLFFVVLLMAQAQGSGQTIEDMKSKLEKLGTQISQSQTILLSSQNDVKSKLQDLALVSSRIAEMKRYMDTISNEIKILNRQQAELQVQLANMQGQLQIARKEYAKALQYTQHGNSFEDRLMFILSAKNFNKMYLRFRYMKQFAEAQRHQGEEIKRQMEEIARQKAELETLKKGKEDILKQQQAQQAQLQAQEKTQRQLIQELEKEQSKVKKELLRKQNEYNLLNTEINNAIAQEISLEEKRRSEAAKKNKPEANSGEKKNNAVTNNTSEYKPDAAAVKLSGSFLDNKGKLPVPITGPYSVVSTFGPQKSPIKGNVSLDNGGINIQGNNGAQARSVFDGVVAKVYHSSDMAFVMVRHGSKYYSVYCNLSTIRVIESDKVKTGSVLGDIATDNSNHTIMLFQIWEQKTKLNPMRWVKFK